ncbi:unnamed protein product [Polarella glacialis]|uniref:Uncharacterized protein n=1 Tax=Polarella glacialis TaxID=89957 RepID=A0A813JAH3_POLGL|nr:unnamed protein product [Polarella glacialis]CAE8671252.1 unnamed protein product [Polarella glacialis]
MAVHGLRTLCRRHQPRAAFFVTFVTAFNVVAAWDCKNLTPQASARENFAAITSCFQSSERVVMLGPGTFLLSGGIELPPNSSLTGSIDGIPSVPAPRLLLATPTAASDFVLRVSSDSKVSLLSLDAGDNLVAQGCCTSVLHISGNSSLVHDVEVMNTSVGVGVYFLEATSKENQLLRVHVHHCHYGVVFTHGLKPESENLFHGGLVELVACDAFTFAGYGEAVNNTVRASGFACRTDAPVAGAAFFCRGNIAGGIIAENEASNKNLCVLSVYDTCGRALDFDSCSHFNVSFNDLPSNALSLSPLGDQDGVFSELNAVASLQAPFSDLPGGEQTMLNLAILHRPLSSARPSVRHEISANTFNASCGAGCVGVGYFVGRGTGLLQQEGDRDSSQLLGGENKHPSIFTDNRVSGSDVGSKRCGENWRCKMVAIPHFVVNLPLEVDEILEAGFLKEGIMPVCQEPAAWPCNEDDFQHSASNFRNDLGCREYYARTGVQLSRRHQPTIARQFLCCPCVPLNMLTNSIGFVDTGVTKINSVLLVVDC